MLPGGNKITNLHIAVLDDHCGDADAREKITGHDRRWWRLSWISAAGSVDKKLRFEKAWLGSIGWIEEEDWWMSKTA